ncbi:MAG: hypothetical protein JXM73_18145 [Anaerolineae bacterium]|nr:hypothetical protein [Anaerolineae bacterium]
MDDDEGSGGVTETSGAAVGLGSMGGLLSSLMGGGGADSDSGGLNLSSGLAQQVIGFVLGKLLTGRSAARGPVVRSGAVEEGLDLDSLAAQLNTERGLDQEYLRSTGMPQELAARTGLDTDTAIEALQKVLAMLMGQKEKKTAKKPAKKKPKSTGKTAKQSAAKKPKSTAKKPASSAKKPKSTAKKPRNTKKSSRKTTGSRAEGIDIEQVPS